jgi:hypothetical protein
MKKKDVAGQQVLFPMINTPWGKTSLPIVCVGENKQETVRDAVAPADHEVVENDGYGDRSCYMCGDDTIHGLCTGHRRQLKRYLR